ncbi:TIGR02453 family protein, partial [Actinomadura sp. DSM 109109]|nr:TIGR02453 family protein [Actinomadura lepetitiana]
TDPGHPRLDLLRHRSLYAHEGWPADPWMSRPDEVIDRVRASWRRLRPLVTWGRDHLGPPDPAR